MGLDNKYLLFTNRPSPSARERAVPDNWIRQVELSQLGKRRFWRPSTPDTFEGAKSNPTVLHQEHSPPSEALHAVWKTILCCPSPNATGRNARAWSARRY